MENAGLLIKNETLITTWNSLNNKYDVIKVEFRLDLFTLKIETIVCICRVQGLQKKLFRIGVFEIKFFVDNSVRFPWSSLP